MVIDYRRLNDMVISDEFPLPKQEDILQALEGSQWLSTSTLHSPTGPCALRADCTESDGVRTDFAESVCTPHGLGGVRADSEVSVRTPHKNCTKQGLNQGLNPGTNSH